jgi:hypothetical protein
METSTAPEVPSPENPIDDLGGDLLYGADAIAKFLFGEKASRRKVYYLAKYTRMPVFRIGSTLCARRSVLANWIKAQEQRN